MIQCIHAFSRGRNDPYNLNDGTPDWLPMTLYPVTYTNSIMYSLVVHYPGVRRERSKHSTWYAGRVYKCVTYRSPMCKFTNTMSALNTQTEYIWKINLHKHNTNNNWLRVSRQYTYRNNSTLRQDWTAHTVISFELWQLLFVCDDSLRHRTIVHCSDIVNSSVISLIW